jgi:hypothetical protein
MKRAMHITLLFFLAVSLSPTPRVTAESPSRINNSQTDSPLSPDVDIDTGALGLDGTGDYLRIPDHPEINPLEAISIEAWVKRVDSTRCETVVGKDFTAAYWLGFCSNKIRFYAHGSGSSVDGNASIPADVWTHVAVTYDGTTRRYYVNGVLDLVSTTNSGPLTTSTADLALGADLNGDSLYEFRGMLDEVRLWNRVRSQAEIQAEMYGETSSIGSRTGLVGYWRLDNSGYDYGGYINRGTLQGNAAFVRGGVEPDWIAAVRNTTSTFSLDGICNPSEYVSVYEYPSGYSDAYITHDDTHLYVCFPALERGDNRSALVGLDTDFDRTLLPDEADYLFEIDIDGVETAKVGNGSGWSAYAAPAGMWEAAAYVDPGNEFTWSAEFRFSLEALNLEVGSSGASVGIGFFEGRGALPTYAFPGAANTNIPASWGEGFLSSYSAPSITWNFSGYVLNDQTGSGIADVPVQLFQSTSGGTFLVESTATSVSGLFTFTHSGLATGGFIIQAQDKVGYTSVSAALGSGGRVITPNVVLYPALSENVSYPVITFRDTQGLPQPRTFDRHYLIVYSLPVLYTDLWPLIEMKRLEGYQVEAVDVSTIEAQTSGYDRGERIRNWLRARWETLRPEPIYALLVGRHDLIPMRDLGWRGDDDHRVLGEENYAPAVVTDWYYADLDSNWDTDGDHFYGEFLYCDPSKYEVPLEGLDLPGRCPPDGSPLREGPYGTSPLRSDDWKPEITLGRILINDRAEVRTALTTSANSEASSSLVKRDTVLAGAMWFFRGRTWDGTQYKEGEGPGIWGEWPESNLPPFGDEAAFNLDTAIKPGLAPFMDQITTLYETASPGDDPALIPTAFTATDRLNATNVSTYLNNGSGLVNVSGHGAPAGVYHASWVNDYNNNNQIDNPADPAESPSCDERCFELTGDRTFISETTTVLAFPVAPVIFANACSTGSWIKEQWVFGDKTYVADDTAIAGRMPALGKAAAWIGGLNIVPVHGLDGMQNSFNLDIVREPLLLGDAFWKGMETLHTAGEWDWRMHTPMLFGDPAYSYWGNPLDTRAAWPQSGRDWFGSGATLLNGPDPGLLYWTRTNHTPKSSPVVLRNGRVLVGTQTGLALFRNNGDLADSASAGVIASYSPAVGTDGVYFVAGSVLYSYDLNLNLRWQTSLGGLANGEPRIGPDGSVWVPTTLGMARVTGAALPEILDGGAATSAAALTPSGAAVWAGSSSTLRGYLKDARGNETYDSLVLTGAGSLTAPATAPDGKIYLGGSNGSLYRVNGFPLPGSFTTFAADGAITTRPIVGNDGSVYFGTQAGSLYALNPDFTLRWRINVGAAVVAPPALDPNRLYLNAGSTLRAYEPTSGALLWDVNLGGTVGAQSTPVIDASRMLYATLNDGKLIAVSSAPWLQAPDNLLVTPGIGEITLQWTDNSSNETGFRVEYCLIEEICQMWTQLPANTTQVNLSQLPVSESIRFRVQAVGAADLYSISGSGESFAETPAIVDEEPIYASEFAYTQDTFIPPPAPSTPLGLSAAAVSAEAIQLDWDYTAPDAAVLTGFKIYRSSAPGGPFNEVDSASASSRSYTDMGLAAGTTYYYRVSATTAGGESALSANASAQTKQVSLAAPTSLAAVQDNLSIALTWLDHAGAETGYTVERRLPGTATFVLAAVLPANSNSYTDPHALIAEGTVEYRVRAFNATAESLPAEAYVTYRVAQEFRTYLPIQQK